jgi:VWFA-related protein
MMRLAGALLAALVLGDDQPVRRQDRVDVERVVVDVRVVDNAGQPVRGLTTADFRLQVDGKPVPIESVRWIEQDPAVMAATATAPDASGDARADPAPVPGLRGRLLVLLFQKDMSSSRIRGLLRIRSHAHEMIDRLGPDDRVAVASHDSHLRLWLDFTSDHDRVKWAVEHSVLHGRMPEPAVPDVVALRPSLPEEAARDAASPEAAVKVLADALAALPGTKTLVMFGWGMGSLDATGVRMTHEYEPALAALRRADTSVFTLDVTQANWHSLEVGLQQVAGDTGGTYESTFESPGTAVRRLEAALAGHYLLSFPAPERMGGTSVRPGARSGEHRLRIRVAGHRGTVLHRTFYADPDPAAH